MWGPVRLSWEVFLGREWRIWDCQFLRFGARVWVWIWKEMTDSVEAWREAVETCRAMSFLYNVIPESVNLETKSLAYVSRGCGCDSCPPFFWELCHSCSFDLECSSKATCWRLGEQTMMLLGGRGAVGRKESLVGNSSPLIFVFSKGVVELRLFFTISILAIRMPYSTTHISLLSCLATDPKAWGKPTVTLFKCQNLPSVAHLLQQGNTS